MSKNVCIVVPCYKSVFSENERISYNRLISLMSNYDIYIIAPEKLRLSLCLLGDPNVIYLPDERFVSRLSYSQMMLDASFYMKFTMYTYILVYQLDAYVFFDKLAEFCNMGYDYIGAPLPKFEWFDLYHNLNINENYSVGNGGFSLRKVDSFIKVLQQKQEIYDRTGMGDIFDHSEDEFWGYCGRCEDIDFKVPDIEIANQFAVWGYEEELFDKYPEDLPFGVHGWFTMPWKMVWMPFVNNTCPTSEEICDFSKYVLKRKIEYLIKHIINYEDNGEVELSKVFCSLIPYGRDLVLWGSGKYGDMIRNLLKIGNRDIKCIYDSTPKTDEIGGIPVLKYTQSNMHTNELIVISSLFYEDGIEESIKKIGNDYLVCSKLLMKAIESYYGTSIEEIYERI